MITHAAVIPLYYDDRIEHNVVLIGNHYSDFLRIISDPQWEILRERESNQTPGLPRPDPGDADAQAFPYDPLSPPEARPEWFLRSPVTAVIQHGYTFDENGDIDGVRSIDISRKVVDPLLTPAEKAMQPLFGDSATAAAFMRSKYENGCVYVEFAADTGVLLIVYYISTITWNATNRIYNGGITELTFCKRPELHQLGNDTLHFDLDTKTALARAEFIVTYFEEPQHIVKLVKDKARYTEFEAAFHQRGDKYLHVSRGIGRSSPFPVASTRCSGKVRPDMTVDGLSSGTNGAESYTEPCTVIILAPCPENPTEYCIVGVIVKSYEDPGGGSNAEATIAQRLGKSSA